jgi:hypothetical protein
VDYAAKVPQIHQRGRKGLPRLRQAGASGVRIAAQASPAPAPDGMLPAIDPLVVKASVRVAFGRRR